MLVITKKVSDKSKVSVLFLSERNTDHNEGITPPAPHVAVHGGGHSATAGRLGGETAANQQIYEIPVSRITQQWNKTNGCYLRLAHVEGKTLQKVTCFYRNWVKIGASTYTILCIIFWGKYFY